MAMPPVVSREEWQAARDELLVEEKKATRLLDAIAARRRRLPMVPMSDDYCSGCASLVDNIGRLENLRARDTNFVVVSNMPLRQMQAFAKRMEWSFPFVSSRGTTFADDCGAGRGGDRVRFDFNMLDLTPYGRQETWEDSPKGWPQTPPYQWWRLHDEY